MDNVINNERIRLIISNFGAEMKSLTLNGFEYLWTPDERYFNRVSPCLFPITGRFVEGFYTHNNKKYYLQLNGIAKDKTFASQKISDTGILLKLSEDEETMRIYTYRFMISVLFSLKGEMLNIFYKTTNLSEEPMPYSVGNHTAYKWPLKDRDNPIDYFLRFEQQEKLESFSPSGFISPYVTNESIWPLDHGHYVNGTRSFKDQKSEWLEYTGADCDYVVRMYNKQFSFVANWALPQSDSSMICIEPSLSISSHGPTLFHRVGIHVLKPGQSETYYILWSCIRSRKDYENKV